MTIPRFAVITAHNRQDALLACIESISAQVDRIIVIDNASDPQLHIPRDAHKNGMIIIRDPEQPPNLSRLWNRGIYLAASMAAHMGTVEWDTAVFGDDVIAPYDWFDRVSYTMRAYGCAAAATHGIQSTPVAIVKRDVDNDIINRMPGWAFMLRGESCLYLDEQFHWWWGDTDLDWRARTAGGVVIAPGPIAVNTQPNFFTVTKPELTQQAGLDRDSFIKKWGHAPW